MNLVSNLQLGSSLGHGHFGEVFLGQDDVHGVVAVKIIQQDPAESVAEWQLRKQGLLQEGQRLSQATHPNVVRVFQLLESQTSDAVHLVMEFCDGGSIQADFDSGPICLSDVRTIATEAALGLDALHARGMLHRDIKPANLLRKNGVTKLGDFGLVTNNIILGYGSAAGYADHLAHEIWHGSGTSIRSDIWALGMTIYRLLHGAEWYSRSPAPRFIVGNGGFSNCLSWLPHIPDRWRRVIRNMLRDDPQSRYQNIGQVMSALATLPVEPDWSCLAGSAKVQWQRSANGRQIQVEWNTASPRRHEWSAWSEPIGATGRSRSLAGSTSAIGRVQAMEEMRQFFAR